MSNFSTTIPGMLPLFPLKSKMFIRVSLAFLGFTANEKEKFCGTEIVLAETECRKLPNCKKNKNVSKFIYEKFL